MTPASIVQTLRSRGYRLERRGDRLHLAGPRPQNEEAALDWLRRHKSEVLALLDAEDRPEVDYVLALDFTGRKGGVA